MLKPINGNLYRGNNTEMLQRQYVQFVKMKLLKS